jgi:hypothetical protein
LSELKPKLATDSARFGSLREFGGTYGNCTFDNFQPANKGAVAPSLDRKDRKKRAPQRLRCFAASVFSARSRRSPAGDLHPPAR